MFEQLGKRIYRFCRGLDDPRVFDLKRKGADISYFKFLTTPWFQSLNIDTVIDIGANEGQFCYMAHTALVNARIYSFEPLPNAFVALRTRMAHCSRFEAINVAIGEANQDCTFFESSMSVCSSFLPMAFLHKLNFPHSAIAQPMVVHMLTLDDALIDYHRGARSLVKIDVQGYEDRVLVGGSRVISEALVVVIECSFWDLYAGQASFDALHDTMQSLGFRYAGSINPLTASTDGRLLQEDCLFISNKLYPSK